MDEYYSIGYLIGAIIEGLICGFVAKKIGENKGYDNQFWWGFWLGVIGVIVVAVKPDNSNRQVNQYPVYQQSAPQVQTEPQKPKETIPEGFWKCPNCGKLYSQYTKSCNCGYQRVDSSEKKESQENDVMESLKKYKQLLDDGIITEEDFNAKKKQILGI